MASRVNYGESRFKASDAPAPLVIRTFDGRLTYNHDTVPDAGVVVVNNFWVWDENDDTESSPS